MYYIVKYILWICYLWFYVKIRLVKVFCYLQILEKRIPDDHVYFFLLQDFVDCVDFSDVDSK